MSQSAKKGNTTSGRSVASNQSVEARLLAQLLDYAFEHDWR
jgi:hypothetical protein